MTTLVTGATGSLGRLIVDSLLERGVDPVQVVGGGRDAAKLAALGESDAGIGVVELDYDRPETILDALVGVDTLVLVSASEPGRRVAQHAAVIEVARHAGIGHLIYTSAPHADTTDLVLAPEHKATEELIRDSGVPFTILRNNWYTEGYAATVEQARVSGEVVVSFGDGKVASASRSDLADAAAAVVVGDGHLGATYELAGDVAWSAEDLAHAVGEVIGSPVTLANVSTEEHVERLTAAGLDAPTAGFVAAIDANIRDGALSDASGDLSRLIGRPTIPLVDGLRALS